MFYNSCLTEFLKIFQSGSFLCSGYVHISLNANIYLINIDYLEFLGERCILLLNAYNSKMITTSFSFTHVLLKSIVSD